MFAVFVFVFTAINHVFDLHYISLILTVPLKCIIFDLVLFNAAVVVGAVFEILVVMVV